MQSNDNSLCEQFCSLSLQARALRDQLSFTISSESPKTGQSKIDKKKLSFITTPCLSRW